MDVDFGMLAARNGKKFQEMSSFENQTERNNRGSYKLVGNCERKFKALVDDLGGVT